MPEQIVPLRFCTVVTTEGEAIQPFVRCPRAAETIDALACTACDWMRSIESGPDPDRDRATVTCTADEVSRPRPIDLRADLGEAAARALLYEVMKPVTTCVSRDLPLAQLKRIVAEKGVRFVAVVDGDGSLQGLISRTDLTTAADLGCVGDIMPPRVHSLPEDAPVSSAIALMACEDVSEIPVVTKRGTVVGVFHALDALRWVAGRMGYASPERLGDRSIKLASIAKAARSPSKNSKKARP